MEKDITGGNIGNVGTYDVEFKDGKLVAKATVSHEPAAGVSVKADVAIEIGARPILEAIKRAVPGQIDDAIIELVAKALGV